MSFFNCGTSAQTAGLQASHHVTFSVPTVGPRAALADQVVHPTQIFPLPELRQEVTLSATGRSPLHKAAQSSSAQLCLLGQVMPRPWAPRAGAVTLQTMTSVHDQPVFSRMVRGAPQGNGCRHGAKTQTEGFAHQLVLEASG